MEHHFATSGPVRLFATLGAGRLTVLASERETTDVVVTGPDADGTRVEQHGDRVLVIAPRPRGLFGSGGGIDATIDVPLGSEVVAKSGSADLDLSGELGTVHARTGSGAIEVESTDGQTLLETGSGTVRLHEAAGDVRIKSGSGTVSLGTTARTVMASTGSGDVELGTTAGPVSVKTGSGDLRVASAGGDVSLTTGSGDLDVRSAGRGRISGKGASGHIRVGIPAGVPVWTDIATASGQVRSSLRGAGQPAEGQDHVEVRARTASGDITLVEL
jgi:DUF4097 and DUF4098 domain-containing protein YvlB